MVQLLDAHMENTFRDALSWHMKEAKTSITDLVEATGVSRDVINKLRSRENSSTTAENAVLIASHYGKTVNQFMAHASVSHQDQLQTMIGSLKIEVQMMLIAQIEGLLRAQRGQKRED